MGHARLGLSTGQHAQDLGLGADLVGELGEFPYRSQGWGQAKTGVALISIYVGPVTDSVGLDCGTHCHAKEPGQGMVFPGKARLQHLPARADTANELYQAWSKHLPHAQDSGLGTGLVGELWGLPCYAATLSGDCEIQGWGWIRLDKATAPIDMYTGWVWGQARLC